MNGTKQCAEITNFFKVVEERSNRIEAKEAIDGGPVGSENPDMSNEKHGGNPCRRKD